MTPVALVTGGAVRVGRAISLGLAEAGYDVVVHYRSSEGPAREVQRQIEDLGRRCVTVGADLADPASAGTVAGAVRSALGRLDVLVNAAANFRATALLEIEAEEWNQVLDVNLRAPHLLVRELAELLREGGGAVINISDHMGLKPWLRYAHHSVSKAALIHLTKIQARALAPQVRVNAIAPGLVLAPEGMPEEALQREIEATLLGRSGTPQDVVHAVLYLASARYVTGQVLVVDGGGTLLE
jgi:pteridine reductase